MLGPNQPGRTTAGWGAQPLATMSQIRVEVAQELQIFIKDGREREREREKTK